MKEIEIQPFKPILKFSCQYNGVKNMSFPLITVKKLNTPFAYL